MRNNLSRIALLLIIILVGVCGYSQQNISLNQQDKSLSEILKKVSSDYNVRFAFNDDIFSQIQTSMSFSNTPLEDFMEFLCEKYGLSYSLIGGTYAFYIDDEIKIIEAINATVIADSVFVDDSPEPMPEPSERDYQVIGIVKNSITNEKINHCSVIANESNTVTNEMGFFKTISHCNGDVVINIKRLGYYEMDTTVHLINESPIEFFLKPRGFVNLPRRRIKPVEFIVSLTEPEIGLALLNPSTTLQIPAVESNDLVNALTVIPGINYLKGTDVGLSIRGGAPSDNLVLIDGIPMIESSHLMGNLSVLNAKFIQQAFVSRGGFGAEYGGRTGGIVDLNGKNGNHETPVVDMTANLLHTNIYFGLPVTENSSLSGAFKKSFVDVWSPLQMRTFDLESMALSTDGNSFDQGVVNGTELNYSDANIKLSITPTNNREVTLSYFSSIDKQLRTYEYPTEGAHSQRNSSNYNTNGFSLVYKDQKSSGWLNSFTFGYNHLKSSSDYSFTKDEPIKDQLVRPFSNSEYTDLKVMRGAWRSELKKEFFIHKFGGGFDSNTLNTLYEDHEKEVIGGKSFNDSIGIVAKDLIGNAYYQVRLAPFNWLNFRAGLRGLVNSVPLNYSIQPRYGVELFPFKDLKLSYSGGVYKQHMYLAYRIDSYGNASSIWHIPAHGAESLSALHHVAGMRFERKGFHVNIEGYNKLNRNKAFFIGEKAIVKGLDVVNYTQQIGEERNRGVDVFLQYRTSIFKHLVSYSLSESMEKVDNLNGGNYFPSYNHQLHRLRLTEIASFQGWTASVNWYYANGTPYIRRNASLDNLEFNYHNNFMQLDVSLVKQFKFNHFYTDIGITVLNVLDNKNQVATQHFLIREGEFQHQVTTTKMATAFSPLFYLNIKYE